MVRTELPLRRTANSRQFLNPDGTFTVLEIGLYCLNARYYKPAWGRFISKDRLLGQVGDPLSHNLYAYVGNNPLTQVDPAGLYAAYERDGGGSGDPAMNGWSPVAQAPTPGASRTA